MRTSRTVFFRRVTTACDGVDPVSAKYLSARVVMKSKSGLLLKNVVKAAPGSSTLSLAPIHDVRNRRSTFLRMTALYSPVVVPEGAPATARIASQSDSLSDAILFGLVHDPLRLRD